MSAAQIIARIHHAPAHQRPEMLEQLERDYGKGFAQTVKDAIESDELIRKAEGEVRRLKRPRRR